MKTCGAKTRSGKPCQRPPMKNGRCRLHGGATPHGPASKNFKHGRYAAAFKGELAEKFSEALGEKNPLDLLPELAANRALLDGYIAKLAGKKVIETKDLLTVSAMTGDITRTVAAIVKNRNDTALTVAEIMFIRNGILRLMEQYVPDPDRRRSFINDLGALIPERVDANDESNAEFAIGAGATSQDA